MLPSFTSASRRFCFSDLGKLLTLLALQSSPEESVACHGSGDQINVGQEELSCTGLSDKGGLVAITRVEVLTVPLQGHMLES